MSGYIKLNLFLILLVCLSPNIYATETFQVHFDVPEHITPGKTDKITAKLTFPQDHYVYESRTNFSIETDKPIQIINKENPVPETKMDQFLNEEVQIFHSPVEWKWTVKVPENVKENIPIKFIVRYQGCSTSMCFMPQEIIEEKTIFTSSEPRLTPEEKISPLVTNSNNQESKMPDNIWLALLMAFIAGLGLSLTPCVYPMIPITVSIIGGRKDNSTPLKGLALTSIYVGGIAITYALLGVIAASTGTLFGSWSGNIWVMGGLSLVLILLALSMFGLYEIQVPAGFLQKFQSKERKGFLGILILGMISGVIASTCTAAPLAGLLLYIAATGNKFLGFWLLFVLAWGVGVPLLIIGTFSSTINKLPRAGEWMNRVKYFFGFVLIAMAFYLFNPFMPKGFFWFLVGIEILVMCYVLGLFKSITDKSLPKKIGKGILLVFFILGILSIQKGWQQMGAKKTSEWLPSLAQGLELAKQKNKPIIVDFYADWCAYCKEMDKKVLPATEVKEKLTNFVLVRMDGTRTTDELETLYKKYEVLGLPTFIFLLPSGQEIADTKITGFMDKETFTQHLDRVISIYEGQK